MADPAYPEVQYTLSRRSVLMDYTIAWLLLWIVMVGVYVTIRVRP